MKEKLTILAVLLLTLTGCGAQWLPEDDTTATNNNKQVLTIAQTFSAGTFVSSQRNLDKSFTTTATKGVFLTYTSLTVAKDTPVLLEKHFDSQSKLQVGQLLKSADQTILVKTILSLQGE